ncbi:Sac1p family [Cryptosporidium xiaoi]|uniref:Sac1p family n=1 Tax=Cryptosporidium xiaoi TaxID=659607 RepID=A0AAV9XW10_9CRYT
MKSPFEPQLKVYEINTPVGRWIKISKLDSFSCLGNSVENIIKSFNSCSDSKNDISIDDSVDAKELGNQNKVEYLYIGSIGSVSTTEPQNIQGGTEKEIFSAYGLVGVWRYDKGITKCLFITEAEFVTEIGYCERIYKINKVEFVDLETNIKDISSDIGRKEFKEISNNELDCSFSDKIESVNLAESMILSIFDRGGFYFSTCSKIDVTKSVRQSIISGKGDLPEERFCWNYNFLLPLYEGGSTTSKWASPIISGFVGSSRFTFGDLNDKVEGLEDVNNFTEINFMLISRRDFRRQGVRYLCRGANSDGNVSNSVETEQIVIVRKQRSTKVLSYLQYRGSIPFIWKQSPNLEKTPPIEIYSNKEFQQKIVNRHFRELSKKYCNQLNAAENNDSLVLDNKYQSMNSSSGVIVANLIDKKRHELVLGTEFEKYLSNLDVNDVCGNDFKVLGDGYSNDVSKNGKINNDVRFCWFDFHSECSKMRWENLRFLINNLVNIGLDDIGFTSLEIQLNFQEYDYSPIYGIIQGNYNNDSQDEFKLVVNSIQNGICRTNCIDCLDRTNVVQSVLGRRVLLNILRQMNDIDIPQISETTSVFQAIPGRDSFNEFYFRQIWSDNADALSKLYSGTPAQKTDFTRYGRRTRKGVVMDSIYSIVRFLLNSLIDGYTQDAYFVFTSQCSYPNSDLGIKRNMHDKLIVNRHKYLSSPIVFAIGQYFTLVALLIFLPLFQVIVSYSQMIGGSAICFIKDFIYIPSKFLFYLLNGKSGYEYSNSILDIFSENYFFQNNECFIYPIGSLIATIIVFIIGLVQFVKYKGSKVATKTFIDDTNSNIWEKGNQ